MFPSKAEFEFYATYPYDDWEDSRRWCDTHGETEVIESGGNSGFVGEGVWWARFACGCEEFDTGTVESWTIE